VGELLNRLQFFDVYSSVWFSAIYLLLMVSLIGCLVPRTGEYLRAMRSGPVLTPRNLARLPHHARAEVNGDPDEVIASVRRRLRGWRITERNEPGGVRTISAERGYLRETGNLVFHFGILGIIVAFALGAMYSYEGQVIVHADGQEFCNSGIFAYDSFRPGLRVDGTELNPFCVRVDDFEPTYTEQGQPVNYAADIRYQSGEDLASGTWRDYRLEVNSPLRTAGDRVYLLGHGYAPTFTVTWPNGESRTQTIQWRPTDQNTMLSQGATKFDPPGITDSRTRRRTNSRSRVCSRRRRCSTATSSPRRSPTSPNPPWPWTSCGANSAWTPDARSRSSRSISRWWTADAWSGWHGRICGSARASLSDDGTRISFDGVRRWVSLQVSHDPTQGWILGFAIAMFVGLGASLAVKRRRFWARVTPLDTDGDSPAEARDVRRSVVELGGLARTDQAGYGEEFTVISRDLLGRTPQD